MKAITLHQPWASLVAVGAKKIETRSWPTKYRGPLAIHSGKAQNVSGGGYVLEKAELYGIVIPEMQYGAVIAIADLVDCIEMTREFIINITSPEWYFGEYQVGRYAWILANIRQIEPVPATGRQGLWNWEPPPGVSYG